MNGIPPVGGGTGTPVMQRMGLSRDDFLLLLTTQLKNQNPLEPLENQEFIAQLATFSTLEQMMNLNENFANFMSINSKAGVVSVLGKEVSAKISDTQTITGRVVEIKYKDNIPYIKIGTIETEFNNIISVK